MKLMKFYTWNITQQAVLAFSTDLPHDIISLQIVVIAS